MKKLIAMLLALVMLTAVFAGCAGKKDENEGTAKTPIADNMETVVNTIVEKNPVEFMGGLMPVDLTDTSEDGLWMIKNFTGLENADKLKDIAVYEPMMSSIAFSMVLVRVTDASEAKAIAQEMNDNIDTRKWGCVQADELVVAGYCDVIMLVMLDSGLELKAQDFVDAFKTVCPGELDFTI